MIGALLQQLAAVPGWAFVGAAVLGDSVGYEIGKHVGSRVLAFRLLQRYRRRVEQAQDLLARRGGSAVVLGRWVAFFRAVMPALAGVAETPYRTFLAYNAAGRVVGGSVVVLAGFVAGASYQVLDHVLGPVFVLAVTALVVLALIRTRRRGRRRTDTPTGVTPRAAASAAVQCPAPEAS